jgi:dihydrofolate synthase/folylpolyglutamate synthase
VGREPLLVLDGAHNPAGAEALAAALVRSFTWGELHLVLGVSANKDVAGVVGTLAPLADVVYATRAQTERGAEPDEVAAAAREAGAADVTTFPTVAAALDAARGRAGSTDAILVTGSLFTVGDAVRALAG